MENGNQRSSLGTTRTWSADKLCGLSAPESADPLPHKLLLLLLFLRALCRCDVLGMHKCTRLPKQLVHKSRKESARRPRLFSTSTKRLVTLPTHLAAKKHEALTLLYKTENLLEPVFKVAERPSDIQSRNRNASVDFWRDILSDTFENLSTGAERPARIVGESRRGCLW